MRVPGTNVARRLSREQRCWLGFISSDMLCLRSYSAIASCEDWPNEAKFGQNPGWERLE
jgi:hypothetical protein